MFTYNKNLEINNANLQEAARILPLSGYDTSKLYVVPTYGTYEENGILSHKYNQPAPPININTNTNNTPGVSMTGSVMLVRNPRYKSAAAGVRISKETLANIWDMTANGNFAEKIDKFVQAQLTVIEQQAPMTDGGSGPVETDKLFQKSLVLYKFFIVRWKCSRKIITQLHF